MCIVTGGKQMSGILNPSLHGASGLVYTRVNTHRIYIDPDYVKFTKVKTFTRIEIVSNITTSSFIHCIQVKII